MTFAGRTEPDAVARKREHLWLAAILILAAATRLWRLDFGLPALNDPDEPIFVMTALDMLREGRLNPEWFGHPATLLLYLLVVVISAVGAVGMLLGAWSDTPGFVAAVFADPGVLILPMRGVMAALGVGSVWLTWAIGRRVGDARTGRIAALLLACNAVHVEWSQVVRTDMLATVLMSWSMLHALAVARDGRLRDHIWAGVAAGLACATKWPALLVLVAPVGVGSWWALRNARHRFAALAMTRRVAIAPIVAVATLFAVSPYLLLDWPTVLRDLGGEARPFHLGATGHGLFGNLAWYLTYPLVESFGWVGAALMFAGIVRLRRDPGALIVLVLTAAVVLLALATQALVWERWVVPVLPIAAVLAGVALSQWRLGWIAALVLATWMGAVTARRLELRAHDPRQSASAWVEAHVPTERSILIEHAAFDLLHRKGQVLFPLGTAGCIDVRKLLKGAPSHNRINGERQGRAIVDIGNVEPSLLSTCEADVAILSNYARYRAEPDRFAAPIALYRRLLARYRRVAIFANGATGNGSVVEIFVRQRPVNNTSGSLNTVRTSGASSVTPASTDQFRLARSVRR